MTSARAPTHPGLIETFFYHLRTLEEVYKNALKKQRNRQKTIGEMIFSGGRRLLGGRLPSRLVSPRHLVACRACILSTQTVQRPATHRGGRANRSREGGPHECGAAAWQCSARQQQATVRTLRAYDDHLSTKDTTANQQDALRHTRTSCVKPRRQKSRKNTAR